MTKKKPLPTKSEQERPAVTVHSAALRNRAMHTEAPSTAQPDVAVLRIAGMLAQLSPANRQLAEKIIRCVLDEQT
ncbi:hypothetical protein GJ700_17725 [Duganella sp. FT92W]|uniref:Uncharacterized protein n=1 Tax=Pseudoduganella rivuli TaxID=2666085 RepID=A0A7X2IPC0_9BURK|nr:hypothetical protein [Pseudoduganella rivuli]MRV73555.1 hypothetical protein [Pseudoduganella rivuli]